MPGLDSNDGGDKQVCHGGGMYMTHGDFPCVRFFLERVCLKNGEYAGTPRLNLDWGRSSWLTYPMSFHLHC